MLILGGFFAMWHLVSMLLLVRGIEERPASTSVAPPPLVPAFLSAMRNKPFRKLLPAWACDSVNNSLISAVLPWYIAYVVDPEASCPAGEEASPWCHSSFVLAAALITVLIAAGASAPIWLALTRRYGKHRVWLSFNLLNAVTNISFLAAGYGRSRAVVAVAALNGVPLGAKFLSEAVLADIIDYDEFKTGRRSEGSFMVFKSFLPKIVGIPCSAIPIALINAFGFVPSVMGEKQPQPEAVKVCIAITFVVLPVIFACVSFVIKLQFPLGDPDKIRQVGVGIGAHMQGQPFIDPISRKVIEPWQPRGRDAWQYWLLESFPSVKDMQTLLSPHGALPLKRTMARHFNTSLVVTAAALATAVATMPLILSPAGGIVPVIATICCGLGISSMVFFHLRLSNARALVRYGYDHNLVRFTLAKRSGMGMDEYTERYDPAFGTRVAPGETDARDSLIDQLTEEVRLMRVNIALVDTEHGQRIQELERLVAGNQADHDMAPEPNSAPTPGVTRMHGFRSGTRGGSRAHEGEGQAGLQQRLRNLVRSQRGSSEKMAEKEQQQPILKPRRRTSAEAISGSGAALRCSLPDGTDPPLVRLRPGHTRSRSTDNTFAARLRLQEGGLRGASSPPGGKAERVVSHEHWRASQPAHHPVHACAPEDNSLALQASALGATHEPPVDLNYGLRLVNGRYLPSTLGPEPRSGFGYPGAAPAGGSDGNMSTSTSTGDCDPGVMTRERDEVLSGLPSPSRRSSLAATDGPAPS